MATTPAAQVIQHNGHNFTIMNHHHLARLEQNADMVRAVKGKSGKLIPVVYANGKVYARAFELGDGRIAMHTTQPRLSPALQKVFRQRQMERNKLGNRGFKRVMTVKAGNNTYTLQPGEMADWLYEGRMPKTSRPNRGAGTGLAAGLTIAGGASPLLAGLEGSKRKVLGSKGVQAAAKGAGVFNQAAAKGAAKSFNALERLMNWVGKQAGNASAGLVKAGRVASRIPTPMTRAAGYGLMGIGKAAQLGGRFARGASSSALPFKGVPPTAPFRGAASDAALIPGIAGGSAIGAAAGSVANDMAAPYGVSGSIPVNAAMTGLGTLSGGLVGGAAGAGLSRAAIGGYPALNSVARPVMEAGGFAIGSNMGMPEPDTLRDRLARYARM